MDERIELFFGTHSALAYSTAFHGNLLSSKIRLLPSGTFSSFFCRFCHSLSIILVLFNQ